MDVEDSFTNAEDAQEIHLLTQLLRKSIREPPKHQNDYKTPVVINSMPDVQMVSDPIKTKIFSSSILTTTMKPLVGHDEYPLLTAMVDSLHANDDLEVKKRIETVNISDLATKAKESLKMSEEKFRMQSQFQTANNQNSKRTKSALKAKKESDEASAVTASDALHRKSAAKSSTNVQSGANEIRIMKIHRPKGPMQSKPPANRNPRSTMEAAPSVTESAEQRDEGDNKALVEANNESEGVSEVKIIDALPNSAGQNIAPNTQSGNIDVSKSQVIVNHVGSVPATRSRTCAIVVSSTGNDHHKPTESSTKSGANAQNARARVSLQPQMRTSLYRPSVIVGSHNTSRSQDDDHDEDDMQDVSNKSRHARDSAIEHSTQSIAAAEAIASAIRKTERKKKLLSQFIGDDKRSFWRVNDDDEDLPRDLPDILEYFAEQYNEKMMALDDSLLLKMLRDKKIEEFRDDFQDFQEGIDDLRADEDKGIPARANHFWSACSKLCTQHGGNVLSKMLADNAKGRRHRKKSVNPEDELIETLRKCQATVNFTLEKALKDDIIRLRNEKSHVDDSHFSATQHWQDKIFIPFATTNFRVLSANRKHGHSHGNPVSSTTTKSHHHPSDHQKHNLHTNVVPRSGNQQTAHSISITAADASSGNASQSQRISFMHLRSGAKQNRMSIAHRPQSRQHTFDHSFQICDPAKLMAVEIAHYLLAKNSSRSNHEALRIVANSSGTMPIHHLHISTTEVFNAPSAHSTPHIHHELAFSRPSVGGHVHSPHPSRNHDPSSSNSSRTVDVNHNFTVGSSLNVNEGIGNGKSRQLHRPSHRASTGPAVTMIVEEFEDDGDDDDDENVTQEVFNANTGITIKTKIIPVKRGHPEKVATLDPGMLASSIVTKEVTEATGSEPSRRVSGTPDSKPSSILARKVSSSQRSTKPPPEKTPEELEAERVQRARQDAENARAERGGFSSWLINHVRKKKAEKENDSNAVPEVELEQESSGRTETGQVSGNRQSSRMGRLKRSSKRAEAIDNESHLESDTDGKAITKTRTSARRSNENSLSPPRKDITDVELIDNIVGESATNDLFADVLVATHIIPAVKARTSSTGTSSMHVELPRSIQYISGGASITGPALFRGKEYKQFARYPIKVVGGDFKDLVFDNDNLELHVLDIRGNEIIDELILPLSTMFVTESHFRDMVTLRTNATDVVPIDGPLGGYIGTVNRSYWNQLAKVMAEAVEIAVEKELIQIQRRAEEKEAALQSKRIDELHRRPKVPHWLDGFLPIEDNYSSRPALISTHGEDWDFTTSFQVQDSAQHATFGQIQKKIRWAPMNDEDDNAPTYDVGALQNTVEPKSSHEVRSNQKSPSADYNKQSSRQKDLSAPVNFHVNMSYATAPLSRPGSVATAVCASPRLANATLTARALVLRSIEHDSREHGAKDSISGVDGKRPVWVVKQSKLPAPTAETLANWVGIADPTPTEYNSSMPDTPSRIKGVPPGIMAIAQDIVNYNIPPKATGAFPLISQTTGSVFAAGAAANGGNVHFLVQSRLFSDDEAAMVGSNFSQGNTIQPDSQLNSARTSRGRQYQSRATNRDTEQNNENHSHSHHHSIYMGQQRRSPSPARHEVFNRAKSPLSAGQTNAAADLPLADDNSMTDSFTTLSQVAHELTQDSVASMLFYPVHVNNIVVVIESNQIMQMFWAKLMISINVNAEVYVTTFAAARAVAADKAKYSGIVLVSGSDLLQLNTNEDLTYALEVLTNLNSISVDHHLGHVISSHRPHHVHGHAGEVSISATAVSEGASTNSACQTETHNFGDMHLTSHKLEVKLIVYGSSELDAEDADDDRWMESSAFASLNTVMKKTVFNFRDKIANGTLATAAWRAMLFAEGICGVLREPYSTKSIKTILDAELIPLLLRTEPGTQPSHG